MSMSFNGADAVWVAIATAVSVATAVLWLYIGWRAMRAHERLASAAEQLSRAGRNTMSVI